MERKRLDTRCVCSFGEASSDTAPLKNDRGNDLLRGLDILPNSFIVQLMVGGMYWMVNGLRATRDYMKKVCAYVQQDDLFVGSLTVEEHLRFMAKLRMGHKYSTKDKENRVQDVMNDLGLKDSAKSLIGTRTRRGISGGEKKRLAFASEILTSPPILFCDEPTSGLDAFLAFQVITVLKRLAEKKRMTILLTIHQPSSQVFELFDRIYLLAEGRVAFCGTQAEAQEMWTKLKLPPPKNFNPSDHYLTTLSAKHLKQEYSDRQRVKAICDFYRDSELGQDTRRESRGHQFISE
ncbi:unnamed protein product [Caenorhabditis auriculariae]|uniref:ABC transporter domain-containing protein n=1 Tax=Caenorhabditis auriculariae TaxID=2777116 RepID=A0A8S1H754_9PELO|nr:unnamed protein product [Caenorhabditis auriculariae]